MVFPNVIFILDGTLIFHLRLCSLKTKNMIQQQLPRPLALPTPTPTPHPTPPHPTTQSHSANKNPTGTFQGLVLTTEIYGPI